MIKNVIFDFDGTIVNSRALIVKLYNELAERYGFKYIQDNEIEKLSELSIPNRCKALGVPVHRVPQLGLQAKSRYQHLIGELEPNPGLKDLILKLRESGYNLTIISSNLEPSIRAFLVHNDIEGFDSVYSAKNFFGKHHTIHSFLKKNGIPVNKAVYIGDELRDIEACRKIEMKIISVSWGYDSAKLLEQANPSLMAYRPEDIFWALEKLNRSEQIQK